VPVVKFTPVTVSVNAGLPASVELGVSAAMEGARFEKMRAREPPQDAPASAAAIATHLRM
jgi:hypothetical protein